MDKKFRLLDGKGENVLGDIGQDNAYLTAYANWTDGSSHKDLDVGESTTARFSLSGTSGTYRVLRVQ